MAKRERTKGRKNSLPECWEGKGSHDIRITRHNALSSKAIKVIGKDHPRKVWKANKLTGSRLLLLQFSTIRSHDKHKEEKKKRVSTYLSSKGRHETSDVELLIV